LVGWFPAGDYIFKWPGLTGWIKKKEKEIEALLKRCVEREKRSGEGRRKV